VGVLFCGVVTCVQSPKEEEEGRDKDASADTQSDPLTVTHDGSSSGTSGGCSGANANANAISSSSSSTTSSSLPSADTPRNDTPLIPSPPPSSSVAESASASSSSSSSSARYSSIGRDDHRRGASPIEDNKEAERRTYSLPAQIPFPTGGERQRQRQGRRPLATILATPECFVAVKNKNENSRTHTKKHKHCLPIAVLRTKTLHQQQGPFRAL